MRGMGSKIFKKKRKTTKVSLDFVCKNLEINKKIKNILFDG